MPLRFPLLSAVLFATFLQFSSQLATAQALTPICQPTRTAPIIVASHAQIIDAGRRAEPPLANTKGFGFAWPDTQMGVIKTVDGYEWFTSDGAYHPRQIWQGHWVGSNNYGSVTMTVGTLDNSLGYKDLWRVRVGDWRVVYIVNDAAKFMSVTRVAHRSKVYD
jgi:ParE-like toxin of type II ParDE toxin-antitoxin system